MKTFLVTGGCGFVGSHLVDALLADSETEEVRVIDNFSSGKLEHLTHHFHDSRLVIYNRDITKPIWFDGKSNYVSLMDVDTVFHLAANPDARRGIDDTRLDLEQETLATYEVLEVMRRNGVKNIIFSSSGTVYGDCGTRVCKEGQGERLPISLYGAGKVASEALISAFCGTFGMKAVIYRFGNVVGERLTHGAIFDWMNQLAQNPFQLKVLGDGNQSKPFVYVKEVVTAMLFALKSFGSPWGESQNNFCIPFNLAPSGATTVKFMAEELIRQMGLQTEIIYGNTPQGWAGDIPHCRMDSSKLRDAGFQVGMSSDEAVKHAIEQILKTI